MVIIASYWGGSGSGMSWLDSPPCDASVNCNVNGGAASFSNLVLS